jgi:hypothetical protein
MMKKRLAAIAAVGAISLAAGVGAPAATALPPQAAREHACEGIQKAVFHSRKSHGNHDALLMVVPRFCS